MSKGVKLMTAAACLVGTGILVTIVIPGTNDPSSDLQPSYNGKQLSEWAVRAIRGGQGASVTSDAIRAIGSNGIPCLFKWLSYEPPGWKRTLTTAVANVHLRLPQTLTVDKREQLAVASISVLTWLEDDYPTIATEARKLVSDPKTPPIARTRAEVVYALCTGTASPQSGTNAARSVLQFRTTCFCP
jgi:hypothetical protein